MTKEQKELLLKDLSSRLPYGVKLGFYTEATKETYTCTLLGLEPENDKPVIAKTDHGSFYMLADHIKPYLFPLSSMTDEMWDKEFRGYGITEYTRDSFKYGCEIFKFDNDNIKLSSTVKFINQLIKNHFDIYDLIPKGLANDATKLNVY